MILFLILYKKRTEMLNNKMLVRLNIQVNTLTDVDITIIESKKRDYLKFLSNVY